MRGCGRPASTKLQPPSGPGPPPPPSPRRRGGEAEWACQDSLRVTQLRSGPLFTDQEPEARPGILSGKGLVQEPTAQLPSTLEAFLCPPSWGD